MDRRDLQSYLLFSGVVAFMWYLKGHKHRTAEIHPSATGANNSTMDQLIGNTPLVKLERISEITGCEVFAKMESLNPSGTGKDRAVQSMLRMARLHPSFGPGVRFVEGTSGSTGIALAFQCNAMNTGAPGERGRVTLHIVMPDDQAEEKRALLEKLGAHVLVTPCCAIANKDHYVNRARRLAQELEAEGRWEDVPIHSPAPSLSPSQPSSSSTSANYTGRRVGGAIFLDQFENEANFMAHYQGTGPEIWRQLGQHCSSGGGGGSGGDRVKDRDREGRRMHAFVMSAGTGGTIAGVSKYLKEQDPAIRVLLADPTGSSLLNRVAHGVCYTPQQSERTVRKHRYDSLVEGVGLDRVTQNFALGLEAGLDGGFHIPDQEVVDMAHWLLRHEGLFVGSSSALNVAAAVRTAHALRTEQAERQEEQEQASPESGSAPIRVVTVICDSGSRHLSRLWNAEYIRDNYQLSWPEEGRVPACLQLFGAES